MAATWGRRRLDQSSNRYRENSRDRPRISVAEGEGLSSHGVNRPVVNRECLGTRDRATVNLTDGNPA